MQERIRGFEVVEDWARKNKEVIMPIRKTMYSAGYDFLAPYSFDIMPDDTVKIVTDIKAYMIEDEYLKIVPRSSLGVKKDVILKNLVGVIDCVPEGTKISTSDGYKSVEDIFNSNIKEEVLSYNEEFNEIESDICSEVWIVKNLELVYIEDEDGNSIEIPLNKSVYTENGWVKAKNLTMSDKILTI